MRFACLIYILFFLTPVNAQKVLQLEKTNSTKTDKFFIGQEFTFSLKEDPKYFFTETIQDIKVEEGFVLFTYRVVRLEDIAIIKTYKNNGWSKGISYSLFTFAAAWGGFSIIGSLVSDEPEDDLSTKSWAVPAVAIGLGTALRLIFRQKKHKMGKKWRLRVLDLNPVFSK